VRIGEKVTYRLAQRPGSYVIPEYVRPVYTLLDDLSIATTPAPANVIEKSVADVSFLAGMLPDKFCYHLPLYHQHQRLLQSGIQLSRSTLTTRAIDLLRPIVDAQAQHLLQSRVLAMDEVPIKAGRQAYFWPIYGEDDESVFHYAPSRAHHHVQAFLGEFSATLLSDGYEAYAAYARHNAEVTHAACWSHCRRHFEAAKDSEPAASTEALALIGALYRHEEVSRERGLTGKEKLAYRSAHSEPVVQAFRAWCDRQYHRPDLLPSSPPGQGAALRSGAQGKPAGVPGRSRGGDRHQPPGACPAPHPHGNEELAVRLDGDRCGTHRRHPKPARYLPPPGRGPLHLPGRCAAAHQRAAGQARQRAYPP